MQCCTSPQDLILVLCFLNVKGLLLHVPVAPTLFHHADGIRVFSMPVQHQEPLFLTAFRQALPLAWQGSLSDLSYGSEVPGCSTCGPDTDL